MRTRRKTAPYVEKLPPKLPAPVRHRSGNPGQVQFENANSPNFLGGTLRQYDKRPVTAAEKYQFGLQLADIGAQRVATVGWHTAQAPNTWTPPQLPAGLNNVGLDI